MISGSAAPAIQIAALETTESTNEPTSDETLLPFRNSANCCLNTVTTPAICAVIAASDLLQLTVRPPLGPPRRAGFSGVKHFGEHERLEFKEGDQRQQDQKRRSDRRPLAAKFLA